MEFLSFKNDAFGLDISDYSLKILKLKKKKNKLSVASFAETKMENDIIREGHILKPDRLVQIIQKSLQECQGEKIKTKDVIISLPEEKTFLFSVKVPRWVEENPLLTIMNEAKNFLPLSLKEFSIDFDVLPSFGENQERQFLVSAIEKDILEEYFFVLKKANLRPLVFEPESFALCRAIFKKNTQSPCLVVDFGGAKTNLIVFWNGFVREVLSLSISGRLLTEMIAKELNIEFSEAESMKINYGLGRVFKLDFKKWKNEIFEIILPTIVALVQEIKKFISYYETHDSQAISHIFLAGGGSNLKGLAQFLSYELDLKVEKATPFLNIYSPFSREKQLVFGTVLGSALLGVYDQPFI